MRSAVFLDRDGVINRGVLRDGKPSAPFNLSELELLPGVGDALESLRAAGFVLVVVTNQPDVARGRVPQLRVDAIHAHMRASLPLDDVRVCYHDDADGCQCRKPKPGMIQAAAKEHNLQIGSSFIVGDRWRDIGAGRAAGCRTILVNAFQEPTRIEPDIELPDLPAAADWILQK